MMERQAMRRRDEERAMETTNADAFLRFVITPVMGERIPGGVQCK